MPRNCWGKSRMDLSTYESYVETLEELDEEMRFEYILDIAKKKRAKPFPEEAMNDAHLMHGCLSKVWILHDEHAGRHYFRGHSDAAIVEGLVAVMTDSFSGLTTGELQQIKLDHIRRLNLGALTTQRQVGMMAMLKHIQKLAGARAGIQAA